MLASTMLSPDDPSNAISTDLSRLSIKPDTPLSNAFSASSHDEGIHHQPPTSPLLQLPRELRDMIYAYLLSNRQTDSRLQNHIIAHAQRTHINWPRPYFRSIFGLVNTSQQFRHEVWQHFLKHEEVTLAIFDELVDFHEVSHVLEIEVRQLPRMLAEMPLTILWVMWDAKRGARQAFEVSRTWPRLDSVVKAAAPVRRFIFAVPGEESLGWVDGDEARMVTAPNEEVDRVMMQMGIEKACVYWPMVKMLASRSEFPVIMNQVVTFLCGDSLDVDQDGFARHHSVLVEWDVKSRAVVTKNWWRSRPYDPHIDEKP